MKRVFLASTSPRRKELLGHAGIVCEVVPTTYEEDMSLKLPPAELATYLSRGKARSALPLPAPGVVVAADTFVVLGGQVLGKPYSPERAKEMLRALSGVSHEVITGFTVLDTEQDKEVSKAVSTSVRFKVLDERVIDIYIASGEPLDRAGAYAIQGGGAAFVDHIEGEYSNVVGLPMTEVLEALRAFGVASQSGSLT